jgi:NAD(P)-dependent dehydrogenase (short-subunit alcohol dehydrogenase family)
VTARAGQIRGPRPSGHFQADAVTLAFAIALESTHIKVNIACPGHTATGLNNYSGARRVEQGARRAIQLALLDANGPTGTFSDEDGPVAW